MMQLNEILNKYNFRKRTICQEITFDEIENLIKFQLPEDYRFYLSNFIEREGFIGPQYLRLWDLHNVLENNNGYEIITYLTNILAIGTNGAGECIGLEYLYQNNYRIVLFPFIGMDEKEYYIEIGSSFTDMLIRLDSGKEWF